MRVVRMTPDDVLARLGDLLARLDPDRAPDAAAYFRKALQINPSCVAAEAGLGYLAASEGRFPEAITHYDAAMALDADDFHYPYLAALSRLGESPRIGSIDSPAPGPTRADLPKARDLLRRTIQLRPGFAEAYVSLGETYLEADEKGGEGIEVLQKAQQLLPTRMDVVADLVLLNLRAGDRVTAGDLVEKTMVPSGDSRALRRARSALEGYDNAHAPTQLKPGHQGAGEAGSD